MAELSIKKARSILKEAKKDYTEENEDWTPVFEDDIPDDEKKLVEEAGELVEMAEEARDAGQEHPAIEKILFLADVDGDSPSNPEATEEPWEGYDDLKAGKVIRELPDLDNDALALVFEYERENKNRDTIIEALEEIAEEEGIELEGDEDEGDYKPWGKYDEDTPKSIIKQIRGMNTDDPEFFQNILDYESENEDRARIKSEIEARLETIQEEGEEVAEDSETQEEETEGDLTRQDIEEMDLGELFELVEYNELDPDEVLGTTSDPNEARVKVAAAFGLEWPEENESEGEEGEEGITSDLDWEVLSQMELGELKGVIKEKDLGFRAGPKTDLDALREKIADALEIQKPAEQPWRGYDKREAKKIIAKLSKLDDDELKAVYDYESENEARKSILKKLDEIAADRGLGEDEESEEEENEEEPVDEETPDEEIDEAEEEDEEKTRRRRKRKGKAKGKTKGEAEDEDTPEDYTELIKHVTDQVEAEHFAIPRPLPENIADLPFDFTELSEHQVRQLHSANLSYFGRASYLAKLEKQLALACKHVADEAFDDAMGELEKIDPETEKDKSATQLKSEADRDPTVRRWRRRQHKHEALKDSMRADSEIYKQNLDSLSREWTMRTEEMDHSGGFGPRGKAGKKAAAKKGKAVKGRK